MLARELAASLDNATDRRTILFLTFSAEESGLYGATHYLANPIAPLDDHALMVNFDMIGRLHQGKLALYTAPRPSELESYTTASPLDVRLVRRAPAGSDYRPFEERGIPVMFAITSSLHDDYHTVKDVSWKIHHANATEVVRLFNTILKARATSDG